jgi:hypothetical protein
VHCPLLPSYLCLSLNHFLNSLYPLLHAHLHSTALAHTETLLKFPAGSRQTSAFGRSRNHLEGIVSILYRRRGARWLEYTPPPATPSSFILRYDMHSIHVCVCVCALIIPERLNVIYLYLVFIPVPCPVSLNICSSKNRGFPDGPQNAELQLWRSVTTFVKYH